MVRLSDFASDEYSQFGEDGMIEEIFRRVGARDSICVEFGAADGLHCSNTARLWKSGWAAALIEADPELYPALAENTAGYGVSTTCVELEPTGDNSVDAVLGGLGIVRVDFMSIDVDGDDYAIWEAMTMRPLVVCIEYNQSIPPHIDLRQAQLGDCFAASARALCNLAKDKGYTLVGLSRCNLFFVDNTEAWRFHSFERDLERLFDYSALTYVVTDVAGRAAVVGTPPWGWSGETYLGETVGDPIRRLPIDPEELFRAYERAYGLGRFVTWDEFNAIDSRPEADTPKRLAEVLANEYRLIGLDTTYIAENEFYLLDWLPPFAAVHGYRVRMDPGLMTLIRDETI